MRIFYVADDSPMSALSGSRIWHNNLYLPLCDLGHQVISFDYDLSGFSTNLDPGDAKQRAYIDEHRPRLEQALLEQVRRAHKERPIDLFFSYFYGAHCTAETIREIRSLGIMTVNWYCNASYQLHLVADLAPAYDACLVPEKFRLADYEKLGARPIYVQEAANPNFYKPLSVPIEFDVTFAGQRYGDRPDFVSYLHKRGIAVRVWGPGWQKAQQRAHGIAGLWHRATGSAPAIPDEAVGPPLSDDDLVALYSKSRISLGFSSCGETHTRGERILQVRLRDFEAPMSGAFYMVEAMDELAEFFEPGREMVFYANREDLADKIVYYLAHDAEREAIRQAGMRRARAEHTWHRRFEQAFIALGLPPRGESA